ncbi:helix-turn-helix domain-containing protein [Methylobacterium sp.]|jgi:CRP-like cAMP-binding protein|uniref:Crp/Fnr family transcriptional regulator n=1 Tax=Methylobacterium sp. TaxID=409 RepID=UPI0025E6FE9D|nr:helix-turn-helix domain-containing protein [Methylobacterium sp.]MBY0257389.1 helix-turn-helix domain-containing protein [Methylobacterium sp.]
MQNNFAVEKLNGATGRGSWPRLGYPSASEVLPPNRVLFWQGEPQNKELEILEGAVRAVRLCSAGERQVLAFFWPGDTIHSSCMGTPTYTAEAVTHCKIRSRQSSQGTDTGVPVSAHEQVLREMLDLIQGVSRRSALSRIAWFILRMRNHLPCTDADPDTYKFIIPRNDIADHLGLSPETVCRGLMELKRRQAIEMPTRRTIRFRNVAQIHRIAKRQG